MGNFFKNNEFKTDYKKRPNDQYKQLLSQLDEETKKKFDRRRTWILVAVIAVVFCLIIVLAVTGIGTNKADNAGNILDGSEPATINCLGDSVTAGITVTANGKEICSITYPQALKTALESKLQTEVKVNNYGEKDGTAQNTSYKKMSEAADIVILQYLLDNCLTDEDPEGVLEANIDGLVNQGCLVYLVNYPYASFAEDKAAVMTANQYISKASAEKSILLMDAVSKFNSFLDQGYTEEDLYSADGIHLTETGYELLGQFIAEGLIADAGLN